MVKDSHGDEVALPLENVLNVWYPNAMSEVDKLTFWGHQVAAFLSESPRDSNAEGGVFPAIFGTVFLVLLMAVIVTPLGVVAAIYLHEYAPKTAFTRLIRIAVVNLAGVPSIVYGVFGLGFFCLFHWWHHRRYILPSGSTDSRVWYARHSLVGVNVSDLNLAGRDCFNRRRAGAHSYERASWGVCVGRDPI